MEFEREKVTSVKDIVDRIGIESDKTFHIKVLRRGKPQPIDIRVKSVLDDRE